MIYGIGICRIVLLLILFDTYICQFLHDDLDSVDQVSQSGSCSELDDSRHVQCFRELPNDEYQIVEGSDVLIRCRVAYQKGKLQWAFNGKMLGFNRDIPTHNRMRMPGDESIGDNSLFIEKVKVADSGTYECQLSPAPDQPPRRRITKLTVLKPPSQPIIYQNNIPISNISLTTNEDNELPNSLGNYKIILLCSSLYGHPSPEFEWSINKERVSGIARQTLKFRGLSIDVAKLNETASQIRLSSNHLQNDDIITCGVFNAATRKRLKVQKRILQTSIIVIKRVLPGPIKLQPDVETLTAELGKPFNVVCICNKPGDPSVELNWRLMTSGGSRIKSNLIMTSDWVIQQFSNGRMSRSNIQTKNIRKRWHAAKIGCYGTQKGYQVGEPVPMQIFVKFPPKSVDLRVVSMHSNNSINNPQTVYCQNKQSVRLVCQTDAFYATSLTTNWFIKTPYQTNWKKLEGTKDYITTYGNPEDYLNSMVTELDVSPEMFRQQSNANHISSNRVLLQVICLMKMGLGNLELRKQVKIEQYEEPDRPVISINGVHENLVVAGGEQVKITCIVHGGYPQPNIILIDEQEEQVVTKKTSRNGVIKLEYDFISDSREIQYSFRCSILANHIIDFNPISSETLLVKIAIAPKKLKMMIPNILVGLTVPNNINVRCETDVSYPQAVIEWWWHHDCDSLLFLDTPQITSKLIRRKCQTETLKDQIVTKYDSSQRVTQSHLTLKLTPEHDQSYLECVVVANVKWTFFHTGIISKFTKLSVQFSPRFLSYRRIGKKGALLETNKVMKKQFVLREDDKFELQLKTESNPSINGFTWLYNGQPIHDKMKIYASVDTLSIASCHGDLMGNYSLIVENQLGKGLYSFFLNVTFSPKLLGSPVKLLKVNPENEYKHKAVIMCSAQANPFGSQAFVKWLRIPSRIVDDKTLVQTLLGINYVDFESPSVNCSRDEWKQDKLSVNCVSLGMMEIVSSLQIIDINYHFIGDYKCLFSNSVQVNSAVKTTQLLFPSPPIAVNNQRRSKFIAHFGKKSQLICYFVGYPQPKVIWYKYPNNEIQTDSNQAKSDFKQKSFDFQTGITKTILIISVTTKLHLGKYKCQANNQYGKSEHSVELQEPNQPPVQPKNISLVNVTDTSFTIGWLVGFNGGAVQTTEIKWKERFSNGESSYFSIELKENLKKDIETYTIKELESNKQYEISIFSFNKHSQQSKHSAQSLIIKTLPKGSKYTRNSKTTQKGLLTNLGNTLNGSETHINTNKLLIIILLVLVGVLLISIKISLGVYFVRKKHKKLSKSKELLPSPNIPNRMDSLNYMTNADSMEMRAPSLIRSGMESNMYPASVSDHMSHNGSDNGLKLSYYKTNNDETPFLTPNHHRHPEMDLVASALHRSHYEAVTSAANYHHQHHQPPPGYFLPSHDQGLVDGGYYTAQRQLSSPNSGNHQTRPILFRRPSHTSVDHTIQYAMIGYPHQNNRSPIAHEKPLGYGSSQHYSSSAAVSMTTTNSGGGGGGGTSGRGGGGGGDSNCSQSPPPPPPPPLTSVTGPISISTCSTGISSRNKFVQPPRMSSTQSTGYSPLISQSGAPSTVEEYLSSGNNSDSFRYSNNNDDYYCNQMLSFRMQPQTNSPMKSVPDQYQLPTTPEVMIYEGQVPMDYNPQYSLINSIHQHQPHQPLIEVHYRHPANNINNNIDYDNNIIQCDNNKDSHPSQDMTSSCLTNNSNNQFYSSALQQHLILKPPHDFSNNGTTSPDEGLHSISPSNNNNHINGHTIDDNNVNNINSLYNAHNTSNNNNPHGDTNTPKLMTYHSSSPSVIKFKQSASSSSPSNNTSQILLSKDV